MFHVRKKISTVIYWVFQNDEERMYAMLSFFRSDCKGCALQKVWKHEQPPVEFVVLTLALLYLFCLCLFRFCAFSHVKSHYFIWQLVLIITQKVSSDGMQCSSRRFSSVPWIGVHTVYVLHTAIDITLSHTAIKVNSVSSFDSQTHITSTWHVVRYILKFYNLRQPTGHDWRQWNNEMLLHTSR